MKSSLQVGHCSNLKVIRTLLEFSEASNHQETATKSPQCELCVLRTQAQNELRQQRQPSFTYRAHSNSGQTNDLIRTVIYT